MRNLRPFVFSLKVWSSPTFWTGLTGTHPLMEAGTDSEAYTLALNFGVSVVRARARAAICFPAST